MQIFESFFIVPSSVESSEGNQSEIRNMGPNKLNLFLCLSQTNTDKRHYLSRLYYRDLNDELIPGLHA